MAAGRVDNRVAWIVARVLERVREESNILELEVIAREADGKLRMKDQYGRDTGPCPQTNPDYVPPPGTKLWATPQGNSYVVHSR